ncbi:tyrosine-type recombinase/integrase [Mameliella sp.]|uniref:tyrosine-type recombinase/integrase n=1 Tax=Mameliella sp. TaxID=1924940 RepID=UPI003B514F3E
MDYLIQPRGPGTGWVFRMITPKELVGLPNPWTGKPFGKEIKRGLGTRHPVEARKQRDIVLGRVRELVAEATGANDLSLESALEWRQMIAEDTSREQGVAMVLEDKLERASRQGTPTAQLRSFNKVALGKGYLLSKALPMYLADRADGSRKGFTTLKPTTVNNLHTAVKHLRTFLNDDDELACLEDVTPALAEEFRIDYLPNLTGPRSPKGMTHKTVAKNVTLLRSLWVWAVEEKHLTRRGYAQPWVIKKGGLRKASKAPASRDYFTAAQVSTLLEHAAPGTREGDLLRLAVVTGCRADEIATLLREQVAPDGSSFTLSDGKTTNASRFVPVPEGAQGLLRARLAPSQGGPRLFPEWPLRPSVGKVYALPQWFTRYRRKHLGEETNDKLVLHSLRHTWRTVARRAGINEADINDLGGWAGVRSSNSVYDHGLLEEQLAQVQEQIWAELERSGYLACF